MHAGRQQDLQEQRMRPEHRKHPAQRVVAGQRGGRAAVDRLVAVEPDLVQLPEPQKGSQAEHQRHRQRGLQPGVGEQHPPGLAARARLAPGRQALANRSQHC